MPDPTQNIERLRKIMNIQKGEKGDPGIGGADDPAILEMFDDHINSLTPHPVYDDGPSLFLLYENAKV